MPPRQRAAAASAWALFLALLSVYLLTFTGRPTTTDELRILDGVTSFHHFGDWQLDETLYLSVPSILTDTPFPTHALPEDERSGAWFVLPLYALAHALPLLGMTHTVMLFNALLMAAAGLLMQRLALGLGADLPTATLAGLLLGLGTLVWPYSRTLFRDPMLLAFMLLATLALLRARQTTGRRRMVWLAVGAGACLLAFATKEAAFFALPALLVWIGPSAWAPRHPVWRQGAAAGLVLLLGLMALYPFVPALHPVLEGVLGFLSPALGEQARFADEALYGYLISPSASLWGSSPILLLALPGLVWLWRCGDVRLVLMVGVLVVGFVGGHALTTGRHWFGGLSYPPRFLLPLVPFVLLLALPVLAAAQRRRVAWGVAVVGLALFSGWVQFVNAVSFSSAYSGLLPAASDGLIEWRPALERLDYSRWWLLPQTWSEIGFDVAWWRVPLQPFTLLIGGVLAAAALVLSVGFSPRGRVAVLAGASVVLAGALGGLLVRLNTTDAVMFSQSPGLHSAMATIEREAQPGDLLLLPFSGHTSYILNANRSRVVRPFTLPIPRVTVLAQGQDGSTLDPADSVHLRLPQVMTHFARHHAQAWFLTNSTPFQAHAPRADERFLTTRYYLMREYPTGDIDVRLLRYALEARPLPADRHLPDVPASIRFGGDLRLIGVSLPGGAQYAAGDLLSVELRWRADAPLTADYTVAWFVADAAGVVVQGYDSMPVGNLWPMSRWQPGHIVTDRRALRLPAALPAGEYALWVVVYRFAEGGITRLPVTEGAAIEDTIAVLPVTLEVQAAGQAAVSN